MRSWSISVGQGLWILRTPAIAGLGIGLCMLVAGQRADTAALLVENPKSHWSMTNECWPDCRSPKRRPWTDSLSFPASNLGWFQRLRSLQPARGGIEPTIKPPRWFVIELVYIYVANPLNGLIERGIPRAKPVVGGRQIT